jgi:hypothetical protein
MTTNLRRTIMMAVAAAAIAGIPRVSLLAAPPNNFASADIPSTALRQSGAPSAQDGSAYPAGAGAQVAREAEQADDSAASKDQQASTISGDLTKPMQADMKVQIIRYIDGEFGRAAKPLPGKTNGFTIQVGKPIDDQAYEDALRLQGTAIGTGDPIQVTRVDFLEKKIVLQVNGGARKKFHLMDHLQIGLGGDPDPGGVAPPPDNSERRGEGLGAVLVLDYGKPLPDVSPDLIKQELSTLIDFSKDHSAAVNWVETLSPEFQNAIRDHKALPGMDEQTVIAAIGRPDRKVRQANADGIETEDWIYGDPPARTIFVTFIGEKVTKVEQCGGPESDTAPTATCSTMR